MKLRKKQRMIALMCFVGGIWLGCVTYLFEVSPVEQVISLEAK